ncbi:MAG: phosphate ABC transporter substrate-binding protein PstS [Francisellaceae bacterium]
MKNVSKLFLLAAAGTLTLTLSACGGDVADKKAETQVAIMGAGSSFIYPAMSRWANSYYEKTGVQVNYQPIGSGGGQRQIFAKTVNFAASDQPLSNEMLEKYNLIQFPAIVGGIVPVINVPGIKPNEMVLDGRVLADIYLGKITYWDDPAIEKLNPSLKLPHAAIITVHRADGSGTTYNFATYLAELNPRWKAEVGIDTSLQWPVGIGAKGNQGVAAQVKQVQDSIGYVEYAYAKSTHMTTVKMINKEGYSVTPDLNSFAQAAKYAKWQPADNYNMILANQPGQDSWPIVATTFILLPKEASINVNDNIKKFFEYAYSKEGDETARKLDYVGIPQDVVKGIENYWQAAK